VEVPSSLIGIFSPQLTVSLSNELHFMNLNIIILIYFQLFSMSSWDVARLEVALGMHVLKPTLDPAAVRMKCRRITRHKGFDSRTYFRSCRSQDEMPSYYSSQRIRFPNFGKYILLENIIYTFI